MRNLVYILILSVSSVSAQVKMSAAEANALRSLIKEQAASTKTITSNFTQYKHMDFLSNDIESTGKLSFRAPHLVKWEYTKPFAYSLLFENETLFINNEGNKSNMDIGNNKLFKQLNNLITGSIKGDMFDSTEFDITYYEKGTISEVHFYPKDQNFAKYIKAFQLTFNEKGEVIAIKMVEPSEDYTQIVFSDRKVNQTLSDEVFAH